ncbi:hypothetical protein ACTFIR_012174 [Dictyostelium discoideum]
MTILGSICSFSQFNVKKSKIKNDSIVLFQKSNVGYTNSMVGQIDGRFDNIPPISQKPPNKPNANTTTVTIGKVVCNISSINVTTIECTISPNLRSLSPRYTSGSKRLLITSSSADTERMYNYQLPSADYYYKFEPPTITNTSSIDQTALITIYGTSFGDSNLEILIDGKPCTQHEIDIHTT